MQAPCLLDRVPRFRRQFLDIANRAAIDRALDDKVYLVFRRSGRDADALDKAVMHHPAPCDDALSEIEHEHGKLAICPDAPETRLWLTLP